LWRAHFSEEDWGYFVDTWGIPLSPYCFRHIALIAGEKGIGKSSLLNVLIKAIEPLAGRVPLSKLGGERFALQTLIGKWINVYSEQLSPSMKNLEVINNLVGESDWIFVDRKHKSPLYIRSLKAMIFAANAIPVITSWSGGVMDAFISRLSIISMKRPESWAPERGVADKVSKAEAFAFLLWCRKQLEERGWTVRKRDEGELLDMLLEAQSPVFRFIEEACIKQAGAKVERGKLYDAYAAWCAQQGITKLASRTDFYTLVRSLGFAEKEAKGKRYFVGLTLAPELQQEQEALRWEGV